MTQNTFNLIKDRTVFFCDWFAVRFCQSKFNTQTFSNVILSLSRLQKYDAIPFIVCLVTPSKNYMFLANTTFLSKISHSSQTLRVNNIKGSFLGSNIMRTYDSVKNTPDNFEFLFTSHENYSFNENLTRLVETTNKIAPVGKRFMPSELQCNCIKRSIDRAISFLHSKEFNDLNEDLANRVHSVENAITVAAFIDNVNVRGRIIEYLITSDNDLRTTIVECLYNRQPLPEIFTADKLGDYEREFEFYLTETDIKTKVMFLSSNPKGYNIDKLLSFLAKEKSVYLVYIVAIDDKKIIRTQLCSMFNRQLLSGTRIIKHWAGRNSRGVTQYDGKALEAIIKDFDYNIDYEASLKFIIDCLSDDIFRIQ
ncbi:hypothetical protein [uncultured Cloacibacillus sp.]|uniref:hypothetical protein n=1 Tax=uncultured Cloacibacillus sp. TaxID=889794 RepID=UPI0026DBE81E|nr:hypothetical protein [uncultured Cloacibacillus sp.]